MWLAAAGLLCGQQQRPPGPKTVIVKLSAKGADPDPAKVATRDTVEWTGKNWHVKFPRKFWFFRRSPCQGKKSEFHFDEPEDQRRCVITVVCKENEKNLPCRYKYNSRADDGPWIDPEIEVEPGRSNR
jgi:hypothetical protein